MATREIETNGIRLHTIDEGEGTAVLLLHGWPDSSAMWRHQIAPLVAAGYRVVAPDLRGFGASEKPPEKASYRIDTILADALGVLDALGIERTHVVSHDWGAMVGWGLAMFAPGRVWRHVALSVGHPNNWRDVPIEQREMSWYMLLFQFEGVAEEALRADNWKLFRQLCRDHPEVDTWIRDAERPGALTAGLNWYRANMDPTEPTLQAMDFPDVTVPTLGVWSSGEHYCGEAQLRDSERFVKAEWRYERIEGASHWIPLDAPESVTRLILEWIGRPTEGA